MNNGAARRKPVLWQVVMFITLVIVPPAAYVIGHRVSDNTKALNYICSTTSVLDSLVVAAGDQIQASFDNGTYERLRKQGVITTENIRAAHTTLEKYRDAHRLLRSNSAC